MLLTIAFISFLAIMLAMILAPTDKGSAVLTRGVTMVDGDADGLLPAAQM